MITLGIMKWSNCFSYGKNNQIDFKANPITQLVGLNGHGKSSIALILELVLFNKNSKGVKTAAILNRYIDEKSFNISLEFDKDGVKYFIDTKRASTQTVKLSKDGVDISAHTATATFKLIEDILGFDHKSFCQVVYQSSAQSLEFLVATDTNRKKFLIDFLNLEKYLEAFEIFKSISKQVSTEADKLEASVKVISAWLDKHKSFDLTEKQLLSLIDPPVDQIEERSRISEDLKKIEITNKAIKQNNTYKEILESIDISNLPVCQPYKDPSALIKTKTEYEKELRDASSFIQKVRSLKSSCPTCGHAIDNSKQLELVGEKERIQTDMEDQIKILNKTILEIQADNKFLADNESKTSRWEQYHALYDPKLNPEILSKNDLDSRVVALTSEIEKIQKQLDATTKANQLAIAHNSKVSVVSEQLKDMNIDLMEANKSLAAVTERVSRLSVLQKAFSTNGLIAYKIESMIKDLEDLVNEYLAELSYGRFQLSFIIAGEKLNVVITDNGQDIEMLALSMGELARVNTATLLAIRKLMQNLSNTKINVLILDETIGNLDAEGKEKLVELLVKEEHLNTFLVSHDYTHPLLEKMHIIKENNISRIE